MSRRNMPDGTVETLKTLYSVQMFLDSAYMQHYGDLYPSQFGRWKMGSLDMGVDHLESTPTKIVLRNNSPG